MCSATERPGKLLELKEMPSTDASTRSFGGVVGGSVASLVQQLLGQIALLVASWGGIRWILHLLSNYRQPTCSRDVWSLQELGLTAEIARGRTGRVFQGRINGIHVAVKVCSSLSLPLVDEISASRCRCAFGSDMQRWISVVSSCCCSVMQRAGRAFAVET